MLLWLSACLINREFYEERLAALTDGDGDGFVAEDECDDGNADVHPNASEHCDGTDEDCDGDIDEAPVDAPPWYADDDADGYGDGDSLSEPACDAPAGFVTNDLDCDDADTTVSPAEDEVAYDGLDNDCVDGDLTDVDGDGYPALLVGGGDCDDEEEAVHPGAAEVAYDGVDQDCDGADADDLDGDGYGSDLAGGSDCDDADPEIHPAAEETWANGYTDNDCDGEQEAVRLEFGARAWIGETEAAEAGRRVGGFGDLDADGMAEYLVGAVYDSTSYSDGGAAYVVPGGVVDGQLADVSAIRPGGENWYLPGGIDGGPDADGDGVPDVLVSAPGYDGFRGGAWIISGAHLLSNDATLPGDSLTQVAGDAEEDFVGSDARFLGDVVGDGGDYFGVGAVFSDLTAPSAGAVGIFDASDLGTSFLLSDAAVHFGGPYESAQIGNSVETAGDIDGDGIDDILVAVGYGDLAGILPGGVADPSMPDDVIFRLVATDAAETGTVLMMGDVDGDGARDLAFVYEAEHIRVYTALAGDPVRGVDTPAATIEAGTLARVYDLERLGDLDGDGREETLIPIAWDEAEQSSTIVIVDGGLLTWGASVDATSATVSAVAVRGETGFGYRTALTGDVDGDGWGDVVLGGPSDEQGGARAGAAVTLALPH